jgi:hypothetical protein
MSKPPSDEVGQVARSPVVRSTPTRRDLRDIAGGNITIEEVLSRARFDETLDLNKFSALVEDVTKDPLCYYYTCEKGICRYGTRCRFAHNPEMVIDSLDGRRLSPKGSMSYVERKPLESVLKLWLVGDIQPHLISMIEYRGRVVWFRDGGPGSRELWEKCQRRLSIPLPLELRPMASSVGMDVISNPSIPDHVHPIGTLQKENFGVIFGFLTTCDIRNLLEAFDCSSQIRETRFYSPDLWEVLIRERWSLVLPHIDRPLAGFLSLSRSTILANSFLSTAAHGMYVHAKFSPPPLQSAVPALAELDPSKPGRTIHVSDDELGGITDIRFSESLVACSNGAEVVVLRRGDLVKVSTCRQKAACDRVTLVGDFLVHAGTAGIFIRDLNDSSMPIVKKMRAADLTACVSLDATQFTTYTGYVNNGILRHHSESGSIIDRLDLPNFVTSRMWSQDGRLHLIIPDTETVTLWDIRSKSVVKMYNGGSSFSALHAFTPGKFLVGSNKGCACIDVRKPDSPLWEIGTDIPIEQISVLANGVVGLVHGSTLTAYDTTTFAAPVKLGEHLLPWEVSAVGFGVDGTTLPEGSVFAVKRPKRSGRGTNGILCIGGHGFVDEPN